jgi:hypothetical protein
MKAISVLLILLGSILFAQLNQRYNSIVSISDKIVLQHRTILKKGNYAQMVINKCTEEGIFIRTKSDSGLVYFKDIADLVFPIKDIEVTSIERNEKLLIKKNTPLVLLESKSKYLLVSYCNSRFKIQSSLVSFSNKEFFDSIIK